MTGQNLIAKAPPINPLGPAPLPPAWAAELSRDASDAFAITSVSVPGVNAAEGTALEEAVSDGYRRLLGSLRFPHMLRIWNFLPRILADSQDGLDRYMRFNAGRYRAFKEFFGNPDSFERVVPAASAVGHEGDELVIHALCSSSPGEPISNPRQRAPYRYSRRFGPLPPCFARAMRIRQGAKTLLMIGGTASVRGEDSVHVGNLSAQIDETQENLAALVSTALGNDRPLSLLSRLRVYYVNCGDLAAIQASIGKWFVSPPPIEWIGAELCRPDLLVEIEGLACSPGGR